MPLGNVQPVSWADCVTARNKAESMAPDLWDQCVFAFAPLGATGPSVIDTSSYRHDGTLVNAPTWTPGRYGVGLRLVGASTQYVAMTDTPALSCSQPLSMAVLCSLDAFGSEQKPLGKWGGGAIGYAYLLTVQPSGNPLFAINTGTNKTVGSTVSMVAGTWHHIVGVYNGSDIRVYLDGALVCTPTAATGNITNTTGDLRIGIGSDGANPMTGYVASAIVAQTAWSAGTVRALAADPLIQWQRRSTQISFYVAPPVGGGGQSLIDGSLLNSRLLSGRLVA